MKKINSLTSGTLHSSQLHYYKTKDGRAVFGFSYEYTYGYYVIAIHKEPAFGLRSSASSIAHWLPCDVSPINKKVCFTEGKEPKTLETAKKISMEFAELTWAYIKTGVTIDDQLLKRN